LNIKGIFCFEGGGNFCFEQVAQSLVVQRLCGFGWLRMGLWGDMLGACHACADAFAGLGSQVNNPLPVSATRDYNPTLGRWLVPDPAGQMAVDPANPQSWNMYAYATDNPTTLNDPSGLQSGGGGADCTNIGETTTVFSYNIAFNHTVTNVNETDWMNCAGDGDGFWFLHPSGPVFGAPDTSYQYRNRNAMYVAAQTLIPTWMLESRVYVSTLGQNFLDEFKQGGCVNTFYKGMEQADILGPALNGSPNMAENAINGTANSMAVGYAASRMLTVPFRSSVVRSMLETGENLAGAFAPVYLNYLVVSGLGKELLAMHNGGCH